MDLSNINVLDPAVVAIIVVLTQAIKKIFWNKCLDHLVPIIPGILAFIFIVPVIIISKGGIPPRDVFISMWIVEGFKTAGAASYAFTLTHKTIKRKGKEPCPTEKQ
jgi:hypothetical protein